MLSELKYRADRIDMMFWLRNQIVRPRIEGAVDKLYAKVAQNTNNENDTIIFKNNKLKKKKEALINTKEKTIEVSNKWLDLFVVAII